MDPEVITISKFKSTCLALLKQVKQTGKSVLVTRRGEPVALIQPPPPAPKPESWLGCFAAMGEIKGDIVSPATEETDWDVLAE